MHCFRLPLKRASQFRVPLARCLSSTIRPASAEDLSLIPFFDQPQSKSWQLRTGGLLLHPQLKSPHDFQTVASHTVNAAEKIVDRILAAPSSPSEMRRVVKNLDRVSDMLCRVIDLAELVRSAHPDQRWIISANQAYDEVSDYMTLLNTNVPLSKVLSSALNDPSIVAGMSYEAHQTALLFSREFELSGIHLPRVKRERFVALSSEIATLGRQFQLNAAQPRPDVEIHASETPARWNLNHSPNYIQFPPSSLEADEVVRTSNNPQVRRKVFLASQVSTPDELETLHRLLVARGELASLVGFSSYAAMTLDNKLAGSPENVNQFLDALSSYSYPRTSAYVQEIAQIRERQHPGTNFPPMQHWDWPYYVNLAKRPPKRAVVSPGTVFYGLSRLFHHLFGVSLRPATTAGGEVWHDSVRKLDVVDENEGVIGVIYVDLFARKHKPGGAAHYTIQCSRRVDDDGAEGDLASFEHQSQLLASPTYPVAGRDGLHHRPSVALLSDIRPPDASKGAARLDWHEVVTLAHEMGHALHSMLGRTDYQNVSGTRCATDLVEIPSLLMEHFMSSPIVQSLFTHPGLRSIHPHNDAGGLDILQTNRNVVLAYLDQVYHSPRVHDPDFDTTAEFERLQNSRGVLPHPPGSSWQTRFVHLFGYGATYYAYLFDRAIASQVWKSEFQANPLDRERGEKYRTELLRYGGGKDPWLMLSRLIDSPQLANGGPDAMREVGEWGIAEGVPGSGQHM